MRLLFFFISFFIFENSRAVDSFDPTRTFFKRLSDNTRVTDDNWAIPFLVVTTAQSFEEPAEKVYSVLVERIKIGKLEIHGRFSLASNTKKVNKNTLPLPGISITGGQLEGIEKCSQNYCAVKLLNGDEKAKLESSKEKLATYHQLILDRLNHYLDTGDVKGYEDRTSNLEIFGTGIGLLDFLPSRYPKTKDWISKVFLEKKRPVKSPPYQASTLKLEVMNMSGDKMQPVMRLNELIEFQEGDAHLVFEPQIYTNHFFDSSFRFFEVFPYQGQGKKSLLVQTDVMEIDELKKSGLIRTLFKGKMVEGIKYYQSTLLDEMEKVVK